MKDKFIIKIPKEIGNVLDGSIKFGWLNYKSVSAYVEDLILKDIEKRKLYDNFSIKVSRQLGNKVTR